MGRIGVARGGSGRSDTPVPVHALNIGRTVYVSYFIMLTNKVVGSRGRSMKLNKYV